MTAASEPEKQFYTAVLPAEREFIRARRRAVAERDGKPVEDGPADDPIGLAFSGGGIRSATFNLGVLQALDEAGFLDHVDYLSTVSGGGFIGASLSHAMREPGSRFPFPNHPETAEPVEAPAVSYLRTHSNYLAPRGILDLIRLVAVLFRGLLVNLLFVILPLLAQVATLAAVIYGPGVRADLAGEPFQPTRLTLWALLLALGWVALYPLGVAVSWLGPARDARMRDLYERSFSACLLLVAAAALLDFQRALLPVFGYTVYGD